MYRRLLVLALALVLLGAVGCSSKSESDSSGSEEKKTESPAAAEPAAAESAEISLPDGWAISDVITEDEVGAITGKTMTYFPEAGSAAQSGRPTAGYTNEGQPNTKLYIGVDVAGGESGFETAKGFAEAATIQDVSGLGDTAIACTFAGGNVGVLVLKGDAVIRIDWPTAAYGDDAAGLGSQLANLLLDKMFE